MGFSQTSQAYDSQRKAEGTPFEKQMKKKGDPCRCGAGKVFFDGIKSEGKVEISENAGFIHLEGQLTEHRSNVDLIQAMKG